MSQEPIITNRARLKRNWPRWARRGLLENVAIAFILLGVLMLVQPFSITLYGWSFVTVLAGIVMFTIVSKFPE
jgi:VIT1/CCC1 family predicted Fe2+/Mn2+ transporter